MPFGLVWNADTRPEGGPIEEVHQEEGAQPSLLGRYSRLSCTIDGAMVKAPLALEAVGPNSMDRGKKWEHAPRAGGRPWRPALPHRDRSERP